VNHFISFLLFYRKKREGEMPRLNFKDGLFNEPEGKAVSYIVDSTISS